MFAVLQNDGNPVRVVLADAHHLHQRGGRRHGSEVLDLTPDGSLAAVTPHRFHSHHVASEGVGAKVDGAERARGKLLDVAKMGVGNGPETRQRAASSTSSAATSGRSL